MPRTVRDTKLDSRSARDKLKPRAKPYYKMLIPGTLHLGYRRRKKGLPGRWLVRRYIGLDGNGVGRYRSKDIALADDYLDADGKAIFSYAQAQQRAHEWRTGGETDAPSGPLTVGVAVAKYITSLAHNGRPTADTQARAGVHIIPTLGALLVEELTTERLRRWLADMAKLPALVPGRRGAAPRKFKPENNDEVVVRRRKSTANRNLAVLKAALNHCFDEGLARSNDAWGRRLKPFKQVDTVRSRFLDVAEAKRLINAADPKLRAAVQRCINLSREAATDHYIPKRLNVSGDLVLFNYGQLMQNLDTWLAIAKGWETAKLGKPKPSAEDKDLAAQTALELCQQHNIATTTYKKGKYCRIAAALYGDPDANVQYQCLAVLELLRMESRINDVSPEDLREMFEELSAASPKTQQKRP